MGSIRNYLLPRVCVYFLVIFTGLTLCFFIPRFTPLDPVRSVIARYEGYAQYYDPQTIKELSDALKELYGLKGDIVTQYFTFFKRILTGDFGPSISYFPVPVMSLIANSLSWTIILLSISVTISWIFGNILGGIGGYYKDSKLVKILTGFVMMITPIPYFIMSLILIVIFTSFFPWWPLTGAYSIGVKPSFTFSFFVNAIQHAFLPALSLVLSNFGWWFITMSSLSINTKTEDYVAFAKAIGLADRRIMFNYVIRNSLLTQVTGLTVRLGAIFSGALITEVAFSYPGIGLLFYMSIINGDFNLLMGLVTLTILGVSTATLLVDLLYPLVDPRIRYR